MGKKWRASSAKSKNGNPNKMYAHHDISKGLVLAVIAGSTHFTSSICPPRAKFLYTALIGSGSSSSAADGVAAPSLTTSNPFGSSPENMANDDDDVDGMVVIPQRRAGVVNAETAVKAINKLESRSVIMVEQNNDDLPCLFFSFFLSSSWNGREDL